MNWLASSDQQLADLDEDMAERYLRRRAAAQTIQPGDRAALKRLLSALRQAGAVATAAATAVTRHGAIFGAFSNYLRRERGLVATSTQRHLPVVRLFLREVCPDGTGDLGGSAQATSSVSSSVMRGVVSVNVVEIGV